MSKDKNCLIDLSEEQQKALLVMLDSHTRRRIEILTKTFNLCDGCALRAVMLAEIAGFAILSKKVDPTGEKALEVMTQAWAEVHNASIVAIRAKDDMPLPPSGETIH